MKIVKMRCPACDSRPVFVNQDLNVCRDKCCERCNVKLMVISSEGQADLPPMPDRERTALSTKETETAMRLLIGAFEKE